MTSSTWKGYFRNFLPVFILLLTVLVIAPAAAMDLSTLSFAWTMIEPKPVMPPVLLAPPGVCRIEHRFTLDGFPTPVPEELYNRLEAAYEPVVKRKREDLEVLLKTFAKESTATAGNPNAGKVAEKALDTLNRGYEKLLLQEFSNDLFIKGERVWEEFSRKNPEFASVTMDQLFSYDAETIVRERRTAHSLLEIFRPRPKATDATTSFFSLPPDKPANGRSRHLFFRVPLFTSKWLYFHEPLSRDLSVLVTIPAAPGDEKTLFSVYGILRKKIETEQFRLQKSLQQLTETIERQTAPNSPADPARVRKSREVEFFGLFADFQQQLIEVIQKEIRIPSPGKVEIRCSPNLQASEPELSLYLETPVMATAAPESLPGLVKQLKALKIPERYNEFRKQHIMPNGGVAVTIGMFLSTLEAQKNVTSVTDLFARKGVAAFYQSALESVLKAEEKAMLQTLEISDVLRELLYLQRRLEFQSSAFAGLPQLKTVIAQLQGFYGYLARSRAALAQFLALAPHAVLRAADPAAADAGAYYLIQLPVSQLVHQEMGGPKGNSSEYLTRMNLFQARVYEDALLQLEKRIQ
jgi:hypothetical protein